MANRILCTLSNSLLIVVFSAIPLFSQGSFQDDETGYIPGFISNDFILNELGLSESQKADFGAFQTEIKQSLGRYAEKVATAHGNAQEIQAAKSFYVEKLKSVGGKVEGVLSPQQKERMHQLFFRYQLASLHPGVYQPEFKATLEGVVEDIDLTDEQKEKLEELLAEQNKQLNELVAKFQRDLKELVVKHNEEGRQVLTKSQREKFDKLFGKSFNFEAERLSPVQIISR